jgi:serine/threonine protein kinase
VLNIPDSLKWKRTGQTFGEGGQGQVIEVFDKNDASSVPYAMKIIKPGKPRKVYERFYREIEALQALDHPSIIKIIDYAKIDSDFPFYVMELIKDAETLAKKMEADRNPFYDDARAAIDLFIQIMKALEACHEHDPMILHRDLSPSNILVLPDASIKLIDFGLCQIEEKERITLTDENIGTQNYRAPECEAGSEYQISGYSDIYSAGKILWAAITGRNAFARESPVFNAMSMNEIFPHEFEPWHLHNIFERTIRHDPGNRFEKEGNAINLALRIRFLITSGYLPLELIGTQCPICGYGFVDEYNKGTVLFGNPNPLGTSSLKCDYCGYCFPVDLQQIRQTLEARKTLK